jgi:hypothetical protein
MRGDLHAQDALTLPSLDVLSFTLAKREQVPGRAFSIAVFEERKHRKTSQLAADVNGTADQNGVVRVASSSKALAFAADHHYAIILYAEDLAPTPAPVVPTPSGMPSTFPSASASPGPSPSPSSGFGNAPLQGGTLIR